jgi:hypothetical protein
VIVAKKDYNLAKHPDIEEASNLEVIKLMTSLTSKDLVSCRFCWKHYYWFLNYAGVAFLRKYLFLAENVVPNTQRKPEKEENFERRRKGRTGSKRRRKMRRKRGTRKRKRRSLKRAWPWRSMPPSQSCLRSCLPLPRRLRRKRKPPLPAASVTTPGKNHAIRVMPMS